MSGVVEQYTIRPVPDSARHGRARGLLPFWFTVNASVYTIGLGAFAALFRLGLWPTIAAIVAGAAAGGAFMAAHSAQGPRLGVPQLVQSRAQFGFYGAVLPNAAMWLLFLSTLVGALFTAGEALAGLWHIGLAQAVMAVCFVAWLLAAFGYRVLHAATRLIAVAALIMACVLLARLAQRLGGAPAQPAAFHVSTWLSCFSSMVVAQVAWAPYVADYSRYLPAGTSPRQAFWHTYLGSVTGAAIFASIGAMAGTIMARTPGVDPMGYLSTLLPGAAWLPVIVLLLGTVAAATVNVYSSVLAALAIASRSGGAARALVVRGIGAGLIMAFAGYLASGISFSLLIDITNLAAPLIYLVIPWSAINLVDYYVVRRGRYDVRGLFLSGGRKRDVNWRTMLAFLAGVAAEVPFADSVYPAFEGPVATAWNGLDISWLAGFIVAGGLYYLASPGRRPHGAGRQRRGDGRGRLRI
jgi:nucleobase:cation symporter-1, NCS1 family